MTKVENMHDQLTDGRYDDCYRSTSVSWVSEFKGYSGIDYLLTECEVYMEIVSLTFSYRPSEKNRGH